MKYEPGKHHRRSIRLKGYDYTGSGAYYVTIVTHRRACLFGEIVNGEMRLSEVGRITEACWRAIREHFPQAELGAFVVMPNHIHGILILHGHAAESPHVGAQHVAPLHGPSPRVIPGSVGAIVRAYKSSVTRQIVQHRGGAPVIWQRNYYEHIIRDERDHQNVYNYILANPFNWETDDENER